MKPGLILLFIACCTAIAVAGFKMRTEPKLTLIDTEKQLLQQIAAQVTSDTLSFYCDTPQNEFLVYARFSLAPKIILPVAAGKQAWCLRMISKRANYVVPGTDSLVYTANDSSYQYMLTKSVRAAL